MPQTNQMSLTCNASVFIYTKRAGHLDYASANGRSTFGNRRNRVLGCRSEFTCWDSTMTPDTRARISAARSAKPPPLALRAKMSNVYRHGAASLVFSSYYWSNSRWVKWSSFWGVWWLTDLPCQTRRARWVVGGGPGGEVQKSSRPVGPFYFLPGNKHFMTGPRENSEFCLLFNVTKQ